jgi:uncharacterized membrane protein YfcA
VTLAELAMSLASGAGVGFTLGLVGGGGSILATPLLLYAVGVASPHVAIGTGAVAVAANALAGLAQHARAGNVRWRCAAVFASLGLLGALLGAAIGKRVDGQALLAAFAGLMVVVAIAMLRRKPAAAQAEAPRLSRLNAPRLAGSGFGVGVLSGFFGIGGGFLIVPALMKAADFPMRYAVGTSLVAVFALGAGTAFSYATAGLVDWPVAALFVAGGALGSWLGLRAGARIGARRGALEAVLAGLILLVAAYIFWRALG